MMKTFANKEYSLEKSGKISRKTLAIDFNELLTFDRRKSPISSKAGWKEFFHSARLLRP